MFILPVYVTRTMGRVLLLWFTALLASASAAVEIKVV